MEKTFAIVGASYAGAQLAASARERGFDGRILLIGNEPHAPYQRPPLSKGFLLRKVAPDTLPVRSDAFYAEHDIELLPGHEVTVIDRPAREIVLDDGSRIDYDLVGLTTGARCRRLNCPGAALDGVCYLRNLEDAERLRYAAEQAASVVVIGGGFIGLEVAASLRSRGLAVTVVETQERLLSRAMPALLSQFVLDAHTERGVRCVLKSRIAAIRGRDGHVEAIEFEGGEKIVCDLAVIGIGIVPNSELAERCGLEVSNGIVVDAYARSSDPAIFAAGDCASYPNPWAPPGMNRVRLESVQSAIDLARTAAASVAGSPAPYRAVPWFWSDQYDLKFQMAGLSGGHDTVVVRGSIPERRFSVYYFRGGRLAAVDSVGRAQDHMLARKLLAAQVSLTVAQAQDPAFDLKSLLTARVEVPS